MEDVLGPLILLVALGGAGLKLFLMGRFFFRHGQRTVDAYKEGRHEG